MKIKDGFITRKIGNKIIAVATGTRSHEFNGMIDLNETGEFIWKCLENDTTIDEVAQKVADNYGIDFDKAKTSSTAFIQALKENDLLDN